MIEKLILIIMTAVRAVLPLHIAPPEVTPTPTPEVVWVQYDDGSYTEVQEGMDGTDVDMEDLDWTEVK